MKNTQAIREIKLENESLQFLFINNQSSAKQVSCATGTNYITTKFFASEYPNDRDMEKALNDIEDKFTEHKELKNNNETLICQNIVLAEMLGVKEKTTVSKEIVEEVFNKYVDCAFGEPASILGIDYSAKKLALILLVRTTMYYLGFNEITISKP